MKCSQLHFYVVLLLGKNSLDNIVILLLRIAACQSTSAFQTRVI